MFAQCHDVALKFHKSNVNCFLFTNINHVFSCSKELILTIFRGLADLHLRGVLVIIRDQMAPQVCLCDAKMNPKVYRRTALITF
jgi:hypothetical protein